MQGGIAEQTIQGFGRLGLLIATDVRNPVGPTESGAFFRLRELAVRCIRDPCFSIRASRLNGRLTAMLSGVDLTETRLPDEERARLALFGDGLFAAGRIVSTDDGGRVFHASRIYLRAPKPRA